MHVNRRVAHAIGATLVVVGLQGCGPNPAGVTQTPAPAATKALTPKPVPSVTAPPTISSASPTGELAVALDTPTLAASLDSMGPNERLTVILELPVPRASYGVRILFSPDSSVIYHNGFGPWVEAIDFRTEERIQQFDVEPGDTPHELALSSDGQLLAASAGPRIYVWEVATGSRIALLQLARISAVAQLGFGIDGDLCATDYSGSAGRWQVSDWQEIDRLLVPGKQEAALVMPDGARVVMQAQNSKQAAFYSFSGEWLGEIVLPGELPRLLAVSPQGDRMLVYSNRGYAGEGMSILDSETGTVQSSITLLNNSAAAISSDWSLLAGVDAFSTLSLYRLPEGERIVIQDLKLFDPRFLVISPDNQYLGIYSRNPQSPQGIIQVWARAPG